MKEKSDQIEGQQKIGKVLHQWDNVVLGDMVIGGKRMTFSHLSPISLSGNLSNVEDHVVSPPLEKSILVNQENV